MNEAVALTAGDGAGPGAALRRARESRGLTQQQAAEQLNLDVSVIEAIEHDDFARLGAPVFAKGHLRRYGAMMGLVADDLVVAYEHAGARPEVPTLVPRARQEMMPVRGRPKWPWVVGGALLFVLAAGLATYVSEYGFEWPARAAESAGTASELEPAPAGSLATAVAPAAGVGTPRTASSASGVQPAAGAATAAADPAPPTVPPGHVSVRIAFAADSWAEVYDGSGQAVLYDLGRAGTQRAIAAAAPLSVTIGNAPGVTLAVNGRPAVLPVVPGGGTVARFRIEPDGTVR
ncbi:MAG: helix-turn-helix domain-containing protein [Rhodospirillaceae bacterium]